MKLYPENAPTSQTATLRAQVVHNGKNYGGEKRMLDAVSVLTMTGEGLAEVVTFRTYGAKGGGGSRNYASLWASGNGYSLAGHGFAGGYGYHRPSAALAVAMESAGVSLSSDIAGVGSDAMDRAAMAVAVAMGYPGPFYFTRHGG